MKRSRTWKTPQKAPKADKKAKSRLANTVIQLQTQLDNLLYAEKQAIQYTHWTPEQFDDMDYFELNEIMSSEYTETIDDLQVGHNLSNEDLSKMHTNKQRLNHEAGRLSLNEAIQKVKQYKANQQSQKGGN
ncbi:hypothetical protein [Limosilactobacillus reuteri]|uniref:hypothetical protein n=1 Tax=Limosilactobacillus reuteri TaxID=1598 RepID=UPI0021BA916D|nr:hypothetical protein [Limosilactobacillus reuteri]UXE90210.1 hypothetical protein N4560_04960 [Limosilactobacillus reuteri]